MTRAASVRAPETDLPGLAWFNVEQPLSLDALRGRLVILDFWAFCCINCLHLIPILQRLESAFPRELVVIGVHSPKFPAERDIENVRSAIARLGVAHPVVHDPDRRLWERYGVRAWPTLVLISPEGKIVGQHRGEPQPDKLHKFVERLLDDWRASGELQPRELPLSPLPEISGRFRFPGKLKPMPGARQRWALADSGHHQIVLLDDEGQEQTRFGDGQPGLRDGPASAARFRNPQGLICSPDTIYVADAGNHAIRRISVGEGVVSTLAGGGERGPPLGAWQPARSSNLASPWDLELDGSRLFFANAGSHQLGVLDLARDAVCMLAGTGVENLRDGAARQAQLAQPSGLVLDDSGDTLFFVDSESSSVRSLTLDHEEQQVHTLVGQGLFAFGGVDGAFAEALLQHPLGLCWLDGQLLVADSYNDVMRMLDLEGGRVRMLGHDFQCEDALCIPANEPCGIWADGAERVLLVDSNNHRVLEYSLTDSRYRTWAT